jgi:hypothetical protein
MFAILSFTIHFFPEAILREELISELSNNYSKNVLTIASIIGFFAHFIVDIVTGIMLSFYWKGLYAQILSLSFISIVWIVALYTKINIFSIFPEKFEGIILIIGAFFLAMFVHLPHKPKSSCTKCPSS